MIVKPNDLVVFNRLPDATVYRVLEVDGFHLKVAEFGQCVVPQWIDKSCARKPSKKQLANIKPF